MNTRYFSVTVLYLAGFCAFASIDSQVAAAASWDPASCTPVCIAPGDQQSPAISSGNGGYIVVWQDSRPDGKTAGTEYPWSVHGRYLNQAEDFPIDVPPDANAMDPDVSGNCVVWTENRGWSTLATATLKGRKPGEIKTIEGTAGNPAVDGNLIVWSSSKHRYDAGKGNIGWITDIRAYETNGPGVGFDVVMSEIVPHTAPAVQGKTVVWAELRHGSSSYNSGFIQYRNIDRDPEPLRAAGTANKMATNPAVYGSLIVWQDNRSGDWDIYGFDIKTRKECVICKNTGDQTNPAIYGGVVVWQDNRNGDWDIYGYDIRTGESFPVYVGKGNQTEPAIYDDVVVWTDDRNGAKDIYRNQNKKSEQ